MDSNSYLALSILFGTSLLLSLILVPVCRNCAHRFGLVDAPDGRRKHQSQPIPRAGGIAILITILAVFVFAVILNRQLRFGFNGNDLRGPLYYVLAGTLLMGFIGFLDDWKNLRGRHKLIGQIAAISLVVFAPEHPLRIQEFSMFGIHIDLGYTLGILFTYFWMLGAINALNLIDGMDGLLGSISFMICLTYASIAIMMENTYVAVVALVIAGAIIGFLRYNLPPASVYLGDCGSMSLGYLLGGLAIQGAMKGPSVVAIGIPIAMLVLPIFDTTAAIVRRKLTGRSIYTTDRGHLHHCLQRSGLSRRRVLFIIGCFMLIVSLGALTSVYFSNELYAVLSIMVVAGTLVFTRLFGTAELNLMKERVRSVFLAAWYGRPEEREMEIRLQGSADWNEVWLELVGAARQMNLQKLSLDVNAPMLHESYHARWDRFATNTQENPNFWRSEIPLFYQGQAIGRMTAVGTPDEIPMWEKLATLAQMVEHTERCLTTVTTKHVDRLSATNVPAISASITTPDSEPTTASVA